MEKRIEVATYMVKLICDKCEGEMKPTGLCLTSFPPKYPHECQNCKNVINISGKTYPHTEYSEI